MKKITKKLSLNKVNLTELDKNQMVNVRGGEGDAYSRGTRCACPPKGYQSRACTQVNCE